MSQETEWGAVLDAIAQPVLVLDEALRVQRSNAAAEALLGADGTALAGAAAAELLPGDYAATPPRVPGWRFARAGGGWVAAGEEGAGADRQVQAEQLAAVQQLATGVAQELGPPLTAVSVAVEYLLKGAERGTPLAQDLETVLAQMERIGRVARVLVELARPASPALQPVDFNQVVGEGYALLERRLRRGGVEGTLALDDACEPMMGDANQLQQVVIDLVLAAQRAAGAGGAGERRIRVITHRTTTANELRVSAPGTRLDDAELARLFLPFLARAEGGETGLFQARGIVYRHGGTLDARPADSTLIARFPLDAAAD